MDDNALPEEEMTKAKKKMGEQAYSLLSPVECVETLDDYLQKMGKIACLLDCSKIIKQETNVWQKSIKEDQSGHVALFPLRLILSEDEYLQAMMCIKILRNNYISKNQTKYPKVAQYLNKISAFVREYKAQGCLPEKSNGPYFLPLMPIEGNDDLEYFIVDPESTGPAFQNHFINAWDVACNWCMLGKKTTLSVSERADLMIDRISSELDKNTNS